MNTQPALSFPEMYPLHASSQPLRPGSSQMTEAKLPSVYIPLSNQLPYVQLSLQHQYSQYGPNQYGQRLSQQMNLQMNLLQLNLLQINLLQLNQLQISLQMGSQMGLQSVNQLAPSQPQYLPPQTMYFPGYYPSSVYQNQSMYSTNQYRGYAPNNLSWSQSSQSNQSLYQKSDNPTSPMSFGSGSDIKHDYDIGSQTQDRDEKPTMGIDYTSLVRCTISPALKRRRRSKQKDVMPVVSYPCTQCGKVFQKPYNLKSHMKTHSNEKPFECSLCGKTFARSHDKKRHELLHAGEKNFKCEGFLRDGVTHWGCGKKFARSDALARHFRTETGWLCIKPLMDEAKTVENEQLGHPNDGDHHPHLNHHANYAPQATRSHSHSHSDSSLNSQYLENSSFIRRLIQSK